MTIDKMKSAGYLANHMARLFALRLHEQIKPLGIAPAQFAALLELWNDEGITQRQLVQRLDVEQATMANTIARMERDGLIMRKPHASDRRAQLIWLTQKARALETKATGAAKAVNEQAVGAMPEAEREHFLQLMQMTIRALSR